MWQLFTITSLFAESTARVIDKVTVVDDKAIDNLIAAFYRTLLFFIFTLVIGLLGLFGKFQFSFNWWIVMMAALWMASSFFYSYLLKKIQITDVGVLSYLTPFLFLIIDLFLFKTSISNLQIIGITLLIMGGVIFEQKRNAAAKLVLSRYIWMIFIFNVIVYGLDEYVFKYAAIPNGINETSYIASVWLLMTVGFIIIIIFSRKVRLLFKKNSRSYAAGVTASKGVDSVGALLWLRALSFGAVSQISALGSVSPLILLLVVWIAQKILKFKADEDLDRSYFGWKVCALILLCAGGWLAS